VLKNIDTSLKIKTDDPCKIKEILALMIKNKCGFSVNGKHQTIEKEMPEDKNQKNLKF